MTLLSDSKLRGFVPNWPNEESARSIYEKVTAAGYQVNVRHTKRKQNRLSRDPDVGRIRALARMLGDMPDVGHTTHHTTGAMKYYYQE